MREKFDLEIIEVVDEQEIDEKHRLVSRIVRWNKGKPVFEIRPLHMKDGEWMNGQHILKCRLDMLQAIVQSDALKRGVEAFTEYEKRTSDAAAQKGKGKGNRGADNGGPEP